MKSEVSPRWSPRNVNSRLVSHILERHECIRGLKGVEVPSKIHSRMPLERYTAAEDRFRRHSADIFTKNARSVEFVRLPSSPLLLFPFSSSSSSSSSSFLSPFDY